MENNFAHIEGTVMRDAEAVELRDGTQVMDFCLIVEGPREERPTFVDVIAGIEACAELEGYVTQGEAIEVTGRLAYRTTTSKEGVRRSRLVVYADEAYEMED